jgi:hypothetical protein
MILKISRWRSARVDEKFVNVRITIGSRDKTQWSNSELRLGRNKLKRAGLFLLIVAQNSDFNNRRAEKTTLLSTKL